MEKPISFDNMCRSKSNNANKRANEHGVRGSLRPRDVAWLWNKCGGVCRYCRSEIEWDSFVLDHIRPMCKQGPNEVYNIACVCYDCDRDKGDDLISEWKKKRSW